MTALRAVLAVGLTAGLLAGCHEKEAITAPPPPLRPEAEAAPPKPTAVVQKDCEPVVADHELKPLSFDERSIPEGNRLAEQGRSKLRTAQSAEVARNTREDMVTQAVDDFITALRADPRTVRQQTPLSNDLTGQGDTALANADKATDPSAQAGLYRESIDKYRNALIKDPYNATATLKLALAYDKVYRKGCAIAMLKRLASLSNNPKWAAEANRNIDAIDANGAWFKGYRKDAMAAVGR